MFVKPTANWYQGNQYNIQSPCGHCGGTVRHERWCITRDPLVRYAYRVVEEPEKLSYADNLILHALGVLWDENRPQEICPPENLPIRR